MSAAREPRPLRLRLPAAGLPARMPTVRTRLARWTTALGVPHRMAEDIVLATHEALTNVADHAYPGEPGVAELDVSCVDAHVVVVVRDHGRWREPAADPGWRGRGLQIIDGLASDVRMVRTARGTTLEMRWALPGPSPRTAR